MDQVLTRLIDPDRYPAVSRAVKAGVFDAASTEGDLDNEFDFGLQRVLDGINALNSSRNPRDGVPPSVPAASDVGNGRGL